MPEAEERTTFKPDRIESLRSMVWEILHELEDLQKEMATFQERRERADALYDDFILDMSEVWGSA